MKKLSEFHKHARENKWAMPHFNFSTLEQLHVLVDVSKELNSPILVGTAEGESKFVGLEQSVALVKSFQNQGVGIFLNLDHGHSIEAGKRVVDAGFDSVHMDLSKEDYEKNKRDTKIVVEYAKSKNSDIEVEGELGYLVTDASAVYDKEIEIPEDSYTQPSQALEYVTETGVDRLAPAVGNLHGIAKNEPVLKIDLVQKIREIIPENLTLVLHGGSGISDEGFKDMIQNGFSNIHINTELRVAYTGALKDVMQTTEEVAPYKYMGEPKKAMAEVVRKRVLLFGSDNKL